MAELGQQKLLRAVHSERQLQEVLVDFWFNHFNVFARKGPRIQPYLTSYERDAIRPHVLGKFRDLLGAVAESPAMLIYLDNWLSSDPDGPDPQTVMRLRQRGMSGGRRPPIGPTRFGTPARGQTPRRQSPQPQPRRRGGLNENFAPELLELHTLGVDGGYTQQDVVDVARARSRAGRSIPPTGWRLRFEPRLHDSGEKQILGQTIEAGGGKSDGEQVLDMLARHPSTAQFVAMKLARRFVADDPPSAVVARAAATFRDTDGDLREVVRAIVTSPEFLSPEAYGGEGQDALGIRGERGARHRRPDVQRAVARAITPGARHAAVSLPAPDRIRRHRRCVDQRRCLVEPNEFRHRAGERRPGAA